MVRMCQSPVNNLLCILKLWLEMFIRLSINYTGYVPVVHEFDEFLLVSQVKMVNQLNSKFLFPFKFRTLHEHCAY